MAAPWYFRFLINSHVSKRKWLKLQPLFEKKQIFNGMLIHTTPKRFENNETKEIQQEFDERILISLVCPLSKLPLRYDKVKNELVSDSINIAFAIKNGIPNLNPSDARVLKNDDPN